MTTQRRVKWRKVWTFFVLLVLLGAGWVGWVQWKIHAAMTYDLPDQADVGIVLGASLWNDVPSPGLRERLDHAVHLFKAGRFSHIIVSGGLDLNGSTITEAEGMRNYLVSQGIPQERIELEKVARSTYENIVFSKMMMDRQGWKHAMIVTHHYHGARALEMARFIGLEQPSVSTTPSKVLFMPWHRTRETLAFTKWEFERWQMVFGWKPKEREAIP